MAKIMMVSTVHQSKDIRIMQKEAVSLAQAGHDVSFVVTNDKEEVYKGVKIIPLKTEKSRKARMFLRRSTSLKRSESIIRMSFTRTIPNCFPRSCGSGFSDIRLCTMRMRISRLRPAKSISFPRKGGRWRQDGLKDTSGSALSA